METSGLGGQPMEFGGNRISGYAENLGAAVEGQAGAAGFEDCGVEFRLMLSIGGAKGARAEVSMAAPAPITRHGLMIKLVGIVALLGVKAAGGVTSGPAFWTAFNHGKTSIGVCPRKCPNIWAES